MKNILVAIDLSGVTSRVLELARELGKAFKAEIHLVHVRGIPSPLPASPLAYGGFGMPEIVPVTVPQVIPEPTALNEQERARLKEWKREISRAGLSATVHQPTGNTVEEILRCAEQVKADAIVMGRHGYGAVYNLLVGSVTEGVLKRSTCPVVLVPGAESKS